MRGAVPVYTFSARQEVVLVEETKMVKAGLLLLKMLNKGGGGGGLLLHTAEITNKLSNLRR